MLGQYAGWGILLAAMLLGGCLPPGQRFLKATVEVDGKPVLETSFGVSDSLPPTAAWKRLEGRVFETAGDGLPGPAGAPPVVLKGKVRLVLTHVKTPFATADLETLTLVKKDGGWALAPGEVARTGGSVK